MPHWTEKDIPNQTGRTALVTGANSGIGFVMALELARAGAKTIVACRTEAKAHGTQAQIQSLVPGAQVEVAVMDMMDLDSVSRFAEDFVISGAALDLLINNAGIMAPPDRVVTKAGFESQWVTNYLSAFLLTGKLLPAILKSKNSRIVTVSSLAHRRAKIFFDDINAEKSYHALKYYGQSKLADAVFGVELQKRLAKSGASAISLIAHPGITHTALIDNSHSKKRSLLGLVMKSGIKLGMSAAQGALPILYAATSPAAKAGKYYGPHLLNGMRGYPVEEKLDRSATNDPDLGEKLWNLSQKQAGFSFL